MRLLSADLDPGAPIVKRPAVLDERLTKLQGVLLPSKDGGYIVVAGHLAADDLSEDTQAFTQVQVGAVLVTKLEGKTGPSRPRE